METSASKVAAGEAAASEDLEEASATAADGVATTAAIVGASKTAHEGVATGRSRRCGGGRWRGAYSSGGVENRSIVDQGAPEGRISLRSQAGGLAKRSYVTSAA